MCIVPCTSYRNLRYVLVANAVPEFFVYAVCCSLARLARYNFTHIVAAGAVTTIASLARFLAMPKKRTLSTAGPGLVT